MRYHPKTVKSTKVPNTNKNNCPKLNNPTFIKYLMTFNRLAPNITGMAKKNENSLATVLEQPQYKPPKIVAPDLDVPGIKAKH